MARRTRSAESRIKELELELTHEVDYTCMFWMKRGGSVIVVGYLTHDSQCEDPISSCDGMGRFITKRDDEYYLSLVGRDNDGNPVLDEQQNLIARLHGPGFEPYDASEDAALKLWEETFRQGKIGTKYARAVREKYRSGYSDEHESGSGKIDAVWIPDSCLLEHITSFPEKNRDEEALKCFFQALDEFNEWAEGNCFGVVIDVFERDHGNVYMRCESACDTCWGHVGETWAIENLEEEFNSMVKHLKGKTMQIEVALPIIRALADGVNPITGEAYPESSPYAEPRALRALYAAVDLMQREVEKEKKRERQPANYGKPWIAAEDRTLIAAYDAGIALPQIARNHQRSQNAIRLRLEKLGKIEPSTNT